MTFTAIVQADTLQEWLTPVDALVDEAKLHATPDALETRAVDPANVAMVDATLDAGAFESYTGTDQTIGLNIDRFTDVLGFADSNDLVHFELNEQSRKLTIQIGSYEHTQALIDQQSIRSEPDIPDLDLPAEVVVETSQLELMVETADLVGDNVTLGVDAGHETFYSTADGDTDDARVEYDQDDVITLEADGARSMFFLDYLNDIVGAMPTTAEITIALGDEYPVNFNYLIADGHGHVTNALSPRIQSE